MPVFPDVGSTIIWPGRSAPLPLGVDDHAERRAVLDRAAGVHALDLDPHFRHRGLDDAR